jgi:hypothetical protein
MPVYEFLNTETDEKFEVFMKISEREKFLKENPYVKLIISAPALVTGISITNKVPEGFKEVLSKVAEKHPTSKVAEQYGKKSIKQIKTEQIVKKHLG